MTFSWRTPLMQWAVALLVVYVLIDVAFLIATGITISHDSLIAILLSAAALLGIGAVMSWIARRFEQDEHKFGRLLHRSATTGYTFIQVGVYLILMSAAGALLSYLVVAARFPLYDVEFAAMDQSLGFDWMGFLEWVNDRPWLAKFLSICYFSSAAQMGVLIIVLSWLGKIRDLQQYLALFAITAGAVLFFSGVFPSYGPYHFYNPAMELSSNLSSNSGRYHLEAYHTLYSGNFTHFDWKSTEGIVTLPSFHTIMAMITAYGMREVRYLAWPSYVLGLIIIISTLPEGGHYLVDVLSGAAIALVALVMVRSIDGQRTRIRDLFPALPQARGFALAKTT